MTAATSRIDLADPATYGMSVPHAELERLRRDDPVSWCEEVDGPGFWSVTRYADVVAVNRDHATFSSARGSVLLADLPDDELVAQQLMLVNMDPPAHARYRQLISKGFTPAAVCRMEADIARAAAEIVDSICDQDTCDLVPDVAARLPLRVIADLLGVPAGDRDQLLAWSTRLMASDDPTVNATPAGANEAGAELFAYFQQLVAARRGGEGGDLVSVLARATVDGERLTDLELDLFFLLLTVAGNESTRNAIAHGVVALIEHPDQRRRLVDDPSLMPSAVEEILRWASPIMQFRRTATADAVIGERKVAEGAKVVIWYVSANRDEAVFPEPYRFDIGRTPNPHVTFGGGGPHICVGAHLARLQLAAVVGELVRRLPDLELTGPCRRLRSNCLNGLTSVPVRFAPVLPRPG